MNTTDLLSQLRKFVLIKSGLRNIDPAHCKTISELIFKETKNYVSETTVKRFFGFAQTLHKFSLFTLNSLSQYIGYSDWESFCKEKEHEVSDVDDVWQSLNIRTQAITDVSLIAKKNSSGVPFTATSKRNFLYSDFDYFLKNDYQFTTISAQPGQGKSILIAHLVEHFFYSENAPYKSDVVLLINSGTISDIIQNGLSLKEWFLKEFKFAGVSELIAYFLKNPKLCKGRIVLIVDGIDQYLAIDKYFKIFVDFLHSIQHSNFIKIVIGLRVNNWVNLQPAITGSAFLTNSWYKGLFFDEDKNTNIPALNQEEILFTLSKIEGKPVYESDLHPGLLNQFRTPFWLQIYYTLKQETKVLKLSNQLLCLELINYFLENKVFLSKNSTEKIFILKEISREISKGAIYHRVAKEKILSHTVKYFEAYQELLYGGILIEEKRLSTAIPTEIVKFLSDDIYTYFLFLQLTEKFEFKPNKSFFEEILSNYAKEQILRQHLINWSIKFCINRNEISALKNIFKLPFTNEEKNKAYDFICDVALFELEKNDSKFNTQSIDIHFVDLLVSGQVISQNYKTLIKNLSERVFDENIQMILHVISSSIAILNLDKVALAESMHLLKRYNKKLLELFPINPYDLISFFNNTLIGKPNNSASLFEKINKFCIEVHKSKPLPNDMLGSCEMITYRLVLMVLFSNKNYIECIHLLEAILKKYPKIFYLRSSVFSSYLLIIMAQTTLKLNRLKTTQRVIKLLGNYLSNPNTYYTSYTEASYISAKANFLNHTGNYKNVIIEASKGIEFANKHNLPIFVIAFLLLKINALKHINNGDGVSITIKGLLNYINVNKLTLPDYVNLNDEGFSHTFKILKSHKQN
ncbi:hypothetical protein [Pedobacter sp. Leaf170]|uniref:hypothetical protein n=1 Tax=Pedobacter sp. Leaf170 TaxID=2876558 RepID=UPI001E3ECC0B|nr:hypothetical protein [Pedobacter sp. Leaf170]